MKKIALVASLFVFAACGGKTEEAAPATTVDSAATAAPVTSDSATPAPADSAAPVADTAKKTN